MRPLPYLAALDPGDVAKGFALLRRPAVGVFLHVATLGRYQEVADEVLSAVRARACSIGRLSSK